MCQVKESESYMKRMSVIRKKLIVLLFACAMIPYSSVFSSELISDGDLLSDGGVAVEEENNYEIVGTYDLTEEAQEEQAVESWQVREEQAEEFWQGKRLGEDGFFIL